MSKVNPKIDLVFKKLFGSEENKDILMSLINAILPLHQQIAKLTLKNPYNVSDYAEGKLSILDIKAEDENGVLYDIEMQIKGTGFYGKRILYYWAKMFGSQLDNLTDEEREEREKRSKKHYSDLNKCIVISLMDFEFFEDDRYHRCFMLKDRETNENHRDLDYLDLYFVELDKFDKKMKFVQTALERWIAFLNNAYQYRRDNLPEELAKVQEIRKASAKLDMMYFDKQERQYYEGQQKFWLDEQSRLQVLEERIEQLEVLESRVEQLQAEAEKKELALKQAEAEVQKGKDEKIAIVKSLKSLNISDAEISKITGFSIKEIEVL